MAAGTRALTTAEKSLTPQERNFVAWYVELGDANAAAVEAGYAGKSVKWKAEVATLTRKPAILAALHAEIGRQLIADASVARRVAMKILTDEEVTPKVRSDLAIKILRLGGHVEPKQEQRDNVSDKSLAELSMQELRDRAEALERELSERAKPVISVKASANDEQPIDIIEEH